MRKTKHWLVTAALLLCSIVANAHDFVVDGIYYKITSSTNLTVEVTYQGSSYSTYADEYSGEVVIPTTVTYGGSTYSVTSIGDYAFHSCKKLTSVVISEGVTSVGDFAFNSCSGLFHITLPKSLQSVGDYAFGSCNNLVEVSISNIEAWCAVVFDSYYSNPLELAGNLYLNGTLVNKLVIPEGVTSIGKRAFSGCTSLTSVSIPTGVTSIGDAAFYGCTKLASVSIPTSVTNINNSTFYGCAKLTSVTIPEGVTSIGSYAFYRCSELSSISIPASLTNIESEAFSYCDKLSKVYIRSIEAWCKIDFKSSLLQTGGSLYQNGVLVTSVILPEGMTSIGQYMFYNCSKLESVTVPNGVTSIGASAFSGCNSLSSIVIPEGVTTIGRRAFYNCTGLTSVAIPSSVDNIGYEVFCGCTSIKELYIADSMEPLNCDYSYSKDYFFKDSPIEYMYLGREITNYDVNYTYAKWKGALKTVIIGDGVTTIPDFIFDSCYYLSSVTISDNVQHIGKYAFYCCDDITSIALPNGLNSIGIAAFSNCNIENLIIPKSVTSIGRNAFNETNELKSIVIEEGNTVYDSRDNCNAIIETGTNTLIRGCKNTTIPYGITSISNTAFYGCQELVEMEIPGSVISIGDNAFYCCYKLSSVTLPQSVTSIGADAFYNCSALASINCEAKTPPTIGGYYTFYNVPRSIPVYVPESSVSAYKSAEYWSEFTNFQAIPEINISLTDGDDFLQSEVEECDNITYTRTFNNTNWQALYVPFEIPYENIKDDFEVAYINDTRQYDRDDDGVKEETVIEAFKITSGTLEANYPYLIRAKEAGEKTITVTDAILYTTEENAIDCSSVYDKYTFTGTYSRMSSTELTGCYALSGGVWQPIAEGATLGAFRFYLQVESRSGSAQAAQSIKMRVIGEETDDEATSIDEVESAGNEQIVYDLAGRRVANPTKGVYIVNGKKMLYN